MRRPANNNFLILAGLLITACGQRETLALRPPYLAASNDSISFGGIVVGNEDDRTLYLINKGDAVLTLEDPVGNFQNGAFVIVLDANEIAPSSHVIARLFFAPAETIDYGAVVTFNNDSRNAPTFDLTLSGLGLEGDACASMVCTSPPPPVCIGSTRSRVYDPAGVCKAGDCDYTPYIETCPSGCDPVSGLCSGNPCAGTLCNDPPPPVCLGNTESRVYDPAGTCDAGVCKYTEHSEPCPTGCDQASGLCLDDPCVSVVCNSPPNGCYAAVGTCSGGVCTYSPANGALCDDGNPCTESDSCFEGSCRGQPKSCLTPPGAMCTNGSTRRYWSAQGVCAADGVCTYSPNTQTCEFGCSGGTCTGDPCNGMNCTSPPNPCYQATGTCNAGSCSYAYNNGADCDDGDLCTVSDACISGSCYGSQRTCTSPPANYCISSDQLKELSGVGNCNSATGGCEYTSTNRFCTYGCQGGVCSNEPDYGSDTLEVLMVFDRDPDSTFTADLRDIDLIFTSPAGQSCSYDYPSPSWGNYDTCQWNMGPVAFNNETVVHSANSQGLADGTYRIRGMAYELCSNYSIGICWDTDDTDTRVEIRINNDLVMKCWYTFEDNEPLGTVIEYATITRTYGLYDLPVPAATWGVWCFYY